jgi:cytochrome b561/polyisoprenoid-binding protein YceI
VTRPTRYTTVAIALHWLIAAALVFQIILGWRFAGAPRSLTVFALFQLHKSVGITILVLTLARIAWRLGHRAPPPPAGQPGWERVASRTVHIGFYVILIGLPLTGWVIVSASKLNIPTLLYGTVPWPHLPFIAHSAAAPKHAWESGGKIGHQLLVKATYVLLALHLGAVAKHQLLDRDEVFGHMAPGAVPGWREPRAWIAAAVFAAIVVSAYAYAPVARTRPTIAAPAETSPSIPAGPPSETLAANTPAPAALPAPATPSPVPPATPTKPVDWRVQPGSTLGFTAKWSGDAIAGQFTRWTAKISFSPDDLDHSKLDVSVDPASVSTGDSQRDSSLVGDDFFDVKDNPRATYSATTFRKVGEGRYLAIGTFELRGVRKPLQIPFTLAIKGDSAVAKGGVTVSRTDFGIGRGEWAATDQIAAPVAIAFEIKAKAKP